MLLMNKLWIVHCQTPPIVCLVLMFRLLLYGDQPIVSVSAKSTVNISANTTEVKSSPNQTLTSSSILSDSRAHSTEIAEIFIAVIYPKSKEALFSRVIKQTIASLSDEFTSATNLKVVAEYTAILDAPNFNAPQPVEQMCQQWNNKPIVAALVLSPFRTAFGHVIASLHNNIPILWATAEVQPGYFDRVPLSRFEVRLDAGCYEILHSLRSLLLATHWHSFTVMHTTSMLASEKYKNILTQPPLVPSILPFRSDSTSYYIFRLLSDISKSTKGVIILICNANDAKQVMHESKKLNMINGDFVWLWIDTEAILIDNDEIMSQDDHQEDEKKAERDQNEKRTSSKFKSPTSGGELKTVVRRTRSAGDRDPTLNSRAAAAATNLSSSFDATTAGVNKTTLYFSEVDDDIERSSTTEQQQSSNDDATETSWHRLKQSKILQQNGNKFKSSRRSKEKLLYGKKYAFSSRNNKGNFSTIFQAKHRPPPSEEDNNGNWNNNNNNNNDGDNRIDDDDDGGEQQLNEMKREAEFSKLLGNHRFQTINIVKRRVHSGSSGKYNKVNPVLTFNENPIRKTASSSFRGGKNATRIPPMPVGLLSIQLTPSKVDKSYVKTALSLLAKNLKTVISNYGDQKLSKILGLPRISCFDFHPAVAHAGNSLAEELARSLKASVRHSLASRKLNGSSTDEEDSLAAKFKILNLVPENASKEGANGTAIDESTKWRIIGDIVGESNVNLDTVVWPGGDIIPVSTGKGSRSIFRVVTAFAPPFVMLGELDEDGQCLRGIECHRFLTSDKDNLTLLVNEIERTEETDEVNELDVEQVEDVWADIDIRHRHFGHKFATNCCYGLSMDLLENVAEELEFDFQLYVVADGLFGTRIFSDSGGGGEVKWNGIMGDLVSGAAHMAFAPLSVSTSRAKEIDFSVPYFFSGVSFLAAPKESTDIPLLAFLLPFSPYLWIAIFTSLHVTAIAVAIYEWLSPFGLNPWGRQRSKNFGMASALWVMWGLLCGHLVQFKAPKSWPNKFLINVWGGFSVIFIASYTANIAALIAGLFFHNTVGDHHDRSLLSQRVGAPKASAAEYYVKRTNQILWEHMQRYSLPTIGDGVQLLKNGSLDILIADTPILDYYRATDHGCKLQKVGDVINEDTYAIGMSKGFPLKDSISAVIAKYASNGYTDILQEKWYGGLPCFKLMTDMAQPRPLGVAAVAGVFLMLGLGVIIGCLILFSEHLFYRYTLPALRKKPKDSIWRSRNVMFFSQKLYRFINCVELVSPHHAARELVHTLRQGQITSLFQKSVKRKEHEQRQQHRSKAQFFEMIQEIRRVQQETRKDLNTVNSCKPSPRKKYYQRNKSPQLLLSPTGLMHNRNRLSPGRLDFARRLSKDVFRSKSSGNLDVRRMSSDINVAAGRFFDFQSAQMIGRRLSHGATESSPPDINTRRASHFVRNEDEASSPWNRSPTTVPEEDSPSTPPPAPLPLAEIASYSSSRQKSLLSSPLGIVNARSDNNLPIKSSSSTTTAVVTPIVLSPNRLVTAASSFFSRDIGPIAARKFSNIDTSSFKGKTVKMTAAAPKVMLNNREIHRNDSDSKDNDDDSIRRRTATAEEEEEEGVVANGRTDSVKSTDHFIEIVLPPADLNRGGEDTGSPSRRRGAASGDSETEEEYDEMEMLSPIEEGSVVSNSGCNKDASGGVKPKIILHMPKKSKHKYKKSWCAGQFDAQCKTRGECDDTTSNDPLQKLSLNDLVTLSQLSEKDLKDKVLRALKDKDPT